jgi:hypothetical protein
MLIGVIVYIPWKWNLGKQIPTKHYQNTTRDGESLAAIFRLLSANVLGSIGQQYPIIIIMTIMLQLNNIHYTEIINSSEMVTYK